MSSRDEVAIIGVGMHPWGKWGRDFAEYGLAAAEAALADAGLAWTDVQFLAGANTVRNGYPGYVSAATFARRLGWSGARIMSTYGACASGSQAIDAARSRILAGLCDVALVVGADTTPKGYLAPNKGDRPDDQDWLRFRAMGATNPVYFALAARRRMELHGATAHDFALVKAKNSRHGLHNPNARYRKEVKVEEVMASPLVSDPLRLLDICATSDGGAAALLCSADYARRRGIRAVYLAGVSTVTPVFPSNEIEIPQFATDSAFAVPAQTVGFKQANARAAYEEAGMEPGDISFAEVYDLSTAMEIDWCEDLGLCAPGEAERELRAGAFSLGGRVPVNPSGGLACFGEAVPAQAIAQVCESTWQLRGQAGARQVSGAKAAICANLGLFGHGSTLILKN